MVGPLCGRGAESPWSPAFPSSSGKGPWRVYSNGWSVLPVSGWPTLLWPFLWLFEAKFVLALCHRPHWGKLSLRIYKRWPPRPLNLHYCDPQSVLYKLRSSLSFALECGQSQFIVFLDIDLVGLKDSGYLWIVRAKPGSIYFMRLEHAYLSYPPTWFHLVGTMDFLIPISMSSGLNVFLSK